MHIMISLGFFLPKQTLKDGSRNLVANKIEFPGNFFSSQILKCTLTVMTLSKEKRVHGNQICLYASLFVYNSQAGFQIKNKQTKKHYQYCIEIIKGKKFFTEIKFARMIAFYKYIY